MKLGEAVRLCRTRKGLKQFELAARCNLSESYLSLIELGKRDPVYSTLEQIARGLEIPTSMLVFLATEEAELEAMTPEVRDKMSAAILRLLQATANERQSPLL